MTYDQKDYNICYGCAAGNALGGDPTLPEIKDFYKQAGFDIKLGVPTARTFLNKWKEIPLAGVKLKDYSDVWGGVGWKYLFSPLRLYNRLKSGKFILTVRLPIRLDAEGFMIPPEDKRGNTHVVYLDSTDGEPSNTPQNKFLVCENSWGKDWGKSGKFKIRLTDLRKCVIDIWELSL